MKLATVSAALLAIALASGHFLKKSVHVMMYMFPEWAYEAYSNSMPRTSLMTNYFALFRVARF